MVSPEIFRCLSSSPVKGDFEILEPEKAYLCEKYESLRKALIKEYKSNGKVITPYYLKTLYDMRSISARLKVITVNPFRLA